MVKKSNDHFRLFSSKKYAKDENIKKTFGNNKFISNILQIFQQILIACHLINFQRLYHRFISSVPTVTM